MDTGESIERALERLVPRGMSAAGPSQGRPGGADAAGSRSTPRSRGSAERAERLRTSPLWDGETSASAVIDAASRADFPRARVTHNQAKIHQFLQDCCLGVASVRNGP